MTQAAGQTVPDLEAPEFPEVDGEILNQAAHVSVLQGVAFENPGIYIWRISGVGSYVGRYTRASRPLKAYNRNVVRLRRGELYRPANPNGFRVIQRALADALVSGTSIRLEIVENCDPGDLNAQEAHYIQTEAAGGLNQ